MTDDEIREMATTNIEDFISWRYFAIYPDRGWLDAIESEVAAYVDSLMECEPALDPSEALLSR